MGIEKTTIISAFKKSLAICIILIVLYIIGIFLPISQFGIRPRTLTGLIGIFASPLIHLNLSHLVTNIASLLILGTIFFTVGRQYSFYIIMHIVIIGGFGTWCIGRSSTVHIGLSGVLYGMIGYLMSIGLFRRSAKTVIISIIAFIFYGGTLWGMFPVDAMVSWEGHLCGFLTGIITAKWYAKLQ